MAATPIWKQIYEDLRDQIDRSQLPQESKLSESEIASRWQVSGQTVQKALLELERVGKVSRKRRIGTVVQSRKGQTKPLVACVVFDVKLAWHARLISAMLSLPRGSVNVLCFETGNDSLSERRILEELRGTVQAIVLCPTCAPENTPLIREIAATIPMAMLDRRPNFLDVDVAQTDNYAATCQALRTVREQGNARIAMFTETSPNVPSVYDRVRAYHDLFPDCSKLARTFPPFDYLEPLGFQQLVQMEQDALTSVRLGPNPPTALFCVRDALAMAAVEACYNLEIRVPDELQVVSFFENSMLSFPSSARIDRIVQDAAGMVAWVVDRIQRRLAGERLAPETKNFAASIVLTK